MPFRTYTQDFIPTISYDRLYSTNDFAQSILTLFAHHPPKNYNDNPGQNYPCLTRALRAVEGNLDSLIYTGNPLPKKTTSLLINGLPVYHETDTNHGANNCSLFYLDCASDVFDTAVQALPAQTLWSYHERGRLYAPQS